MTFSGGGSRAAALAASVLGEMAATRYAASDGPHVLTEDVKLISSVSGGSVTAAWFGLHRTAEHPDGELDGLRQDFLVRDNMKELELDAVEPINWFRLTFGGFSRIGALESLLDERLFHQATLADLNQPGKPFILLNATDMAGGETFALVPRRFDDVCSNHDVLPVATAVSASAAFPILLTPVSFQNFSVGCAGRLRNGEWIKIDLSNPYTPYLNLPEYRDARYSNDLRHGPNTFRDIDYVYLLDGGLADNLGTRSLRSALVAPYDDAGVLRAINDGKIRSLVIVVVNARSDPPNNVYQQSERPGLISMVKTVTSVPIDANTVNSQVALSGLLDQLAAAAGGKAGMAKFTGMKIYGITIDFDLIPADTQAHRDLRDGVKRLPTSWTLTPTQLELAETAGRFLLRRDPCYHALLTDLRASQSPIAGETALPAIPCTTKIDMEKRVTAPRPSS
ncbi:MAG: patatin-like phospholipase family protein [Stellaceae bacterium]